MKNLTTTHRHYPQPHLSNRLQDDVGRLATAFEMVDQDMTAVQQDITTLQQDLIDNRWQSLDLTDATLQADTFYPVLLGLTPAMGSQVLAFRCLPASATHADDANAIQSTDPTPDNRIQWQAAFAGLGDVWAGEHNLSLIRYAHEQGLDLLADYQWDPQVPVAVVWLRGQQVYQVRSSHQRLALLPVATTQSNLETMEPNQVQVYAQGVVCSQGDTSTTYAPLAAINTDQVQVGQVDLLTFLDMQATLTTHATELAQLAAAKAQLTKTQAEQHTALTNQLQQHNNTLTAQLDEQTRLLGRVAHELVPKVGDILDHAYAHAYLPCNGETYPRARYPALAAHLGEATYLDDQGVASFRMPVQFEAKALKQAPTKQWALADSHLWGIAVNAERVFVSQYSKGEIWVYDHAGQRQDVWSGFSHPYGLWASNGRLYVAEYSNNQVQVRDAKHGGELAKISANQAINVQVQGDTLWIARNGDYKVTAHSLTTGQSREIDTQNSPARALAVSGDRLYVAHTGGTYAHQIARYDANTGDFVEAWNPGVSHPYGLAVQGGVLAVADCGHHRVRLFNHLTKVHLGDIVVAGFQSPTACRFDAKGLWVTWASHGVTYHDLTAGYASMRALPVVG